jgi:Transglycosylase SLT domain
MPVLPKLETSQSVFNNVALQSQNIQSSPSDFGAQVGAGAQQIGQAGQTAANDAEQAITSWQNIKNETDTNYAYSKTFAPGIQALSTQYLALQGKDAVDQLPAYQQKMQDLQQQTRDSLTNPMQQKMFDEVSRRMMLMQTDGMGRYADTQNKVYQQQASDGMVQSFQQQAAAHWNDPIMFNGMIQSMQIERQTHGASVGQPMEYTNAQISKDVSGAWVDRLKGIASAGNSAEALNLLNNGETWTDRQGNTHTTDVRSQILPNELPAIQAELSDHAALQLGVQYGNQATAPAPFINQLTTAFMGQESSGGTNAKTSVNGARGAMQIMPDTFKQYAQPGESIDNKADNIAVGQRMLADYAAKYNNDPAKIAVAYFSGPGNVATSGPTPWKNNTADGNGVTVQQYVQGIVSRLGSLQTGAASGAVTGTLPVANVAAVSNASQIAPPPVGMAQDPATMKANQDANAEAAREAAQAHTLQVTGDPIAAKRAGDIAAATVAGNTNAAISAQESRQRAAAGSLALQLAGDPTSGVAPITNFQQLMSNASAFANYSQLSPEGKAAVTSRLTAKQGDVPLTAEGLKSYYQLRGQAVNDPNGFLKKDLSSLYGQMPEKQIGDLINIQTSLAKNDSSQSNKSLNWQQTKSEVDDMLKPMGLGSSAKAGSDESKTTEQFYGRLQSALDQYHDQNQKYPDAIATRKIASSLLVQGTQGQSSWLPGWLGGNSSIPAFQSPDLSKFQVPVPPDQKLQLTTAFQKVMGRAPTDEELTQWYTKYSLSQKGK